jgi:hypothetical protein
MQLTEILLMVITIALLGIWMSVNKMNTRLREHFPSEKEADHDLAIKDPIGHSEAHKSGK